MTVRELIDRLSRCDPEAVVLCADAEITDLNPQWHRWDADCRCWVWAEPDEVGAMKSVWIE